MKIYYEFSKSIPCNLLVTYGEQGVLYVEDDEIIKFKDQMSTPLIPQVREMLCRFFCIWAIERFKSL